MFNVHCIKRCISILVYIVIVVYFKEFILFVPKPFTLRIILSKENFDVIAFLTQRTGTTISNIHYSGFAFKKKKTETGLSVSLTSHSLLFYSEKNPNYQKRKQRIALCCMTFYWIINDDFNLNLQHFVGFSQ